MQMHAEPTCKYLLGSIIKYIFEGNHKGETEICEKCSIILTPISMFIKRMLLKASIKLQIYLAFI